jgi:Cell division septal protein
MERNRGVTIAVVLLVVSLLIVILWISLAYIPVFNISQIRLSGIGNVPASIEKIVAPLYGVNRFKADTRAIEKELEKLPIVKSAKISYSLPALMKIEVELFAPEALAKSGDNYFIVKNDALTSCSQNDFKAFDEIPVVEISTSYSDYLMQFGVDSSFKEVLSLICDISNQLGVNHNLITKVKYDNNNTNSFGMMVLEISSLNTILSVRDKVDAATIIEAVKVVEKNSREDGTYLLAGSSHRYDIYRHALVKRK